ncbi:sensor histidine kinase [Amycolatopsis anabasis]|uniref:sensor histidine kinase n=1 Tax=Amycolatopsis anabasis TaxID=1840409 RepID=UPI00131DD8EC|nr:histidine kinase [Amycolatopsis anabasis]
MPDTELARRHPAALAVRVLRVGTALAIGGGTAFAELAYVMAALPACAFPAARKAVFAGARRFAEFERHRVAKYLGAGSSGDFSGRRALEYLAVRWLVGGLGAGVLLLIAGGAATGVVMIGQLVTGQSLGGGSEPRDWYDPITFLLFGTLLVFVTLQGAIGVAALDRRLARHFLGPTRQELLQRRVSELSTTRAEVVDAVNDERRRIERYLHDGVQQRLVALGMLLGRARRADDRERGNALLHQAHEEAQEALRELREVTWRIYPIALDEGGLHTALEALAERSSVPVTLTYALPERADTATETVAYFVVSEAVTNTIKHANATRIEVTVERAARMIVVRIQDDGIGGARPEGRGLSGLARRVAAADGEFTVDSPPGGPTIVVAELPCA